MKKDWNNRKLPDYIKNKYFITVVIFIAWIFFFDPVNVIYNIKAKRALNKMYEDVEYYKNKITADSLKLHELLSDDENLEKFAREEYLMKKENEDVFIFVE